MNFYSSFLKLLTTVLFFASCFSFRLYAPTPEGEFAQKIRDPDCFLTVEVNELLEMLASPGFNVNAYAQISSRNKTGYKLLKIALMNASIPWVLIEQLLNRGAALSPERSTIVHFALLHRRVDILEELVWRFPALLSEVNTAGQTPLQVATAQKNWRAYTILTEAQDMIQAAKESSPSQQDVIKSNASSSEDTSDEDSQDPDTGVTYSQRTADTDIVASPPPEYSWQDNNLRVIPNATTERTRDTTQEDASSLQNPLRAVFSILQHEKLQ